jgi:fatty acid desaturase
MTPNAERVGALQGESLLLRFATVVLAVVVAAVVATAIGQTWAYLAALVVLLALLVRVVVGIVRYLRVSGDEPVARAEARGGTTS